MLSRLALSLDRPHPTTAPRWAARATLSAVGTVLFGALFGALLDDSGPNATTVLLVAAAAAVWCAWRGTDALARLTQCARADGPAVGPTVDWLRPTVGAVMGLGVMGAAMLWVLPRWAPVPDGARPGWAIAHSIVIILCSFAVIGAVLGALSCPSDEPDESDPQAPIHRVWGAAPHPNPPPTSLRRTRIWWRAAIVMAALTTIGAPVGQEIGRVLETTPNTIWGWWHARAQLDEAFASTTMTPEDYWRRLTTLDDWRALLMDRPFAVVILPPTTWPDRKTACLLIAMRQRPSEIQRTTPGCDPRAPFWNPKDPVSAYADLSVRPPPPAPADPQPEAPTAGVLSDPMTPL